MKVVLVFSRERFDDHTSRLGIDILFPSDLEEPSVDLFVCDHNHELGLVVFCFGLFSDYLNHAEQGRNDGVPELR